MLLSLLAHPLSSPLHNAEDYLKAAGEALALLFVVSWLVTYISQPKYHNELVWEHNPLRSRIGYNNLCIGFDTEPAVFLAQPLYALVLYLLFRAVAVDLQRTNLTAQWLTKGQKFVYSSITWAFGLSSALFTLVFVVSPMQSAVWHTVCFVQYIVCRWAMVMGLMHKYSHTTAGFALNVDRELVLETRKLQPKTKAFVFVYTLSSLLFPILVFADYIHYDKLCATDEYSCQPQNHSMPKAGKVEPEPLVPWYITMHCDYMWFVCMALTTHFLPANESLLVVTQWRTLSAAERKSIRDQNMRGRAEMPLEVQSRAHVGTIESSNAIACLFNCCGGKRSYTRRAGTGSQSGAYLADAVSLKKHFAAMLHAREDPTTRTCPWAGGSGTVHLAHGNVVELLRGRAELLESGREARGNDLGVLRLNTKMFADRPSKSVMLGFGRQHHRVYRTYFDDFWTGGAAEGVRDRLRERVLSRDSIQISATGHLAQWVAFELWISLLGVVLSDDEVADFVRHQQIVVDVMSKPEALAHAHKPLREKQRRWMPKILSGLKFKGTHAPGFDLAALPDEESRRVVQEAIYDTLVFAGGLSVPMVLSALVGLRMNSVVPQALQLRGPRAQSFALEAIRCFPPVFSVTQWRVRDAGSDSGGDVGRGGDIDGSHQTILALAAAMNDASVFGTGFNPDRPLEEFKEKGCSFAEPAGPKYSCPGRNMAVELVATFAELWDPRNWDVSDGADNDDTLLPMPGPPYFHDAMLLKVQDITTRGPGAKMRRQQSMSTLGLRSRALKHEGSPI